MISKETDPTYLKSFKNGIEGCIWEWSGSKLEMLLTLFHMGSFG